MIFGIYHATHWNGNQPFITNSISLVWIPKQFWDAKKLKQLYLYLFKYVGN